MTWTWPPSRGSLCTPPIKRPSMRRGLPASSANAGFLVFHAVQKPSQTQGAARLRQLRGQEDEGGLDEVPGVVLGRTGAAGPGRPQRRVELLEAGPGVGIAGLAQPLRQADRRGVHGHVRKESASGIYGMVAAAR